ncbi:MAG: CDP-paratose 2-epimerase [Candidatus Marinimicrobia bacterium]|nr:CDP-paratose 2-epimerase [Candidatus Neomarinimicrobiota bacterium]|tara:strand:+ start:4364 stop:5425 length:1062 start_codon:yes stop_codon:yes gene_type:complete
MKILITGGCGFLGSNLASHFLKKDYEVIVIDLLLRDGGKNNLEWLRKNSKLNQFYFYKNDIADIDIVEEIFKKHKPFDYICHVAGQVAMTTSIKNPRKDLYSNLIGTFNILESTRKFSDKSLLAFSSTNKVYGDLEWIRKIEKKFRYFNPDYPNGFNEKTPLDFSTPYGCSKGAAEMYIKDWSRVFGLKTVVFRHSSIYGDRQFSTYDQGWVGWFCRSALEQKSQFSKKLEVTPFTISGTGKQVRDLLHVKDAVSLYDDFYCNPSKAIGEVFNIGGGQENSLSLLELFNILKKEIDIDNLIYTKLPRRKSDQDVFIADISKVKNYIGWSPSYSLIDGIKNMIDWCDEAKEIIK